MNSIGDAVTKEELHGVTAQVWSAMADMVLAPAADQRGPTKKDGYVAANVQIIGTWQGAVRLDMDMRLARATTAKLLMIEESEVSGEDLEDAAGELANMTGGGFKTLIEERLAEAHCLSCPSVAIGQDYELFIPRATIIYEVPFTSDFGRLMVTISEKAH